MNRINPYISFVVAAMSGSRACGGNGSTRERGWSSTILKGARHGKCFGAIGDVAVSLGLASWFAYERCLGLKEHENGRKIYHQSLANGQVTEDNSKEYNGTKYHQSPGLGRCYPQSLPAWRSDVRCSL